MQPTPLTERHYYDGTHATPHWIAELYCLWRLCGATACRRAKCCRGDGSTCHTGLALVPNDALDFMAAFEQARDDRLTYDEMIDVCSEEIAALEGFEFEHVGVELHDEGEGAEILDVLDVHLERGDVAFLDRGVAGGRYDPHDGVVGLGAGGHGGEPEGHRGRKDCRGQRQRAHIVPVLLPSP